jgi:Cof subfamily protein (haloacid dehalogenase superfamily)
MKSELRTRLKLAAIDLDGTLLGPGGDVSPANLQAVARLQDAGLQVVLASGRHFNNMHKYAARLPGVKWLVSCQGGELSDADRKVVLQREFLAGGSAREMLETGRALGFSTLIYSIDGVFTEAGRNPGMDFYTDLAGTPPRQTGTEEILKQPVFKILWIGEPVEIDRVGGQLTKAHQDVQAVRTHQRIWEFMPVGTSKASALKVLAARLGVKPEEAVTFGDGDNDVPMFAWSGLSVAMPHGWPAAIREATHVAPEGPADAALARGVDLILARDYAGARQAAVALEVRAFLSML